MLTPEQLAERKKGVGSSDARVIMSGQWYDLWREKTGRYDPPPILSPWDALLRHHIEPAIMDFWETTHGCKVEMRGAKVFNPDYPIIMATLDGCWWDDDRVIDAKLLSDFTPDKDNWIVEKYGWQMVHQMCATGCAKASLYISVGMRKPQRVDWVADEFQAATYIDRCREFWDFVERDIEPPGAPPVEAPLPFEEMREVDMRDHPKANLWGAEAAIWLEHIDSVKLVDKAAKALKGIVDKDVRRAHGSGIEIIRDGRGLSVKKLEVNGK